MPSHSPPGALTDHASDADPLARARELVADLLDMVAQVRGRAAELEAERDDLRRQVAERAGGSLPAPAPDEPSERRARHGDLGRALAPLLSAPRRQRPGLRALVPGEPAL